MLPRLNRYRFVLQSVRAKKRAGSGLNEKLEKSIFFAFLFFINFIDFNWHSYHSGFCLEIAVLLFRLSNKINKKNFVFHNN